MSATRDPRRRAARCVLALVLAASATACDRAPRAVAAGAHLALRSGLLRADEVALEVSSAELEDLAREAAARLALAPRESSGERVPDSWTRLEVRLAEGAAGERSARGVVAELGSDLAAPLCAALGVEQLAGGGFRFQGRDYTDAADALRGVAPDPLRPGRPVGFLLVNEAARFADSPELLVLGWRPFVEVLRSAEIERRFTLSGGPPHDVLLEFDRSALFERPREKFAEYEADGVSFLYRKDPALLGLLPAIARLAEGMRRTRDAVAGFLTESGAVERDGSVELPRTVVHGFAGEAFLDGESALFARRDAATARLMVLLQIGRAPLEAYETTARVLLEQALGPCRTPWLGRGLALDLGLPREELARRQAEVVRATLALSAEEIAQDSGAWRSPLVRGPEQALLARLLLEQRGAEFVARLWRGELALEVDLELEERLHAAHVALAADETGDPDPAPREPELLRGFGFWLGGLDDPLRRGERVQLLQGEPFDELVALGANAVLLSYPVTLGRRSEARLDGEDDGAPASCPSLQELALLLDQARARGLAVVLWPRLLVAEQTSLTARSKWTSEKELREVFADLREHLVHAALLARSGAADWLVLGGSLGLIGRTAAPEPGGGDPTIEALRQLRVEEWGETVARVRAAAGPVRLTLAASGWTEALEADFAADLDGYGLAGFPTWTLEGEPERRPTEDDVLRGFANVLGRGMQEAELRGQPLLLLEVGHARTAGASLLSQRRAGPTDPAAQTEFLEGVLATLSRRRTPVPEGLFLWRAAAQAAPPDPRGFLIDLDAEPELLRQLMQSGR